MVDPLALDAFHARGPLQAHSNEHDVETGEESVYVRVFVDLHVTIVAGLNPP